jgi:LysR family transcriptional regulator for bpeEF and oprC
MDRLRRLELFVRAAEAGSFARAAGLLRLDPSAVSHAVAALEADLRQRLFHRTTRQLRLTPEGEDLLPRARDILQRLEALEDRSAAQARELSGTLRVGMHSPISRQIVMPRLPEFLRRHPRLRLECLLLSQLKDMHASGTEVIIRPGPLPDTRLVARRLATLRLAPYASPVYLRDAPPLEHPSHLARHRCLVHKPISAPRPWDTWIFERGGETVSLEVPAVLVTDDREGLIEAAVAGGGVMRIGMFDPVLVAGGRLKRVLAEWTCPGGPEMYALYRKGGEAAPKVRAFLAFVAECFEAFDPGELTVIRPQNRV